MEEVDKIIIKMLKKHRLLSSDDNFSMESLTPELFVKTTLLCLKEINPNLSLPASLPRMMAQRILVASLLADACKSCGYDNIGYQIFLYPTCIEVRRLFMFLLEYLPEEVNNVMYDYKTDVDKSKTLIRSVKKQLQRELAKPWLPELSLNIYNSKYGKTATIEKCSCKNTFNKPQLNLINVSTRSGKSMHLAQTTNIFHQTNARKFDLIATVLHKNSSDLYDKSIEHLPSYNLNSFYIEKQTTAEVGLKSEKLANPLEERKIVHQELLAEKRLKLTKINASKSEIDATQLQNDNLMKDLKYHEHINLVLENPDIYLTKLKQTIQNIIERRKGLETQLNDCRQSILDKINAFHCNSIDNNIQEQISNVRTSITNSQQILQSKSSQHIELLSKVDQLTLEDATPRLEYTRPILEFIGHIRKQNDDIMKILEDTRNIQKQTNSVLTQLQRQFNYTDDLLFQSAKHDLHAKKAYKLLAMLHSTCSGLTQLVLDTGSSLKKVRELEAEKDDEILSGTKKNLDKILDDTKNFENVISSLQLQIRSIS